MKFTEPCPHCGNNDSRSKNDKRWKGERRKCNVCNGEWTVGNIMPAELTYTDREVLDFELSDFYDVYESTQKLNDKTNINQRVLNAKVKTDFPIILQFLSDLHIGNPGVDIERFKSLTKYILETPNLYIGLLGDEVDTYFANPYLSKPMLRQVFSPRQQLLFLDKWLQQIQSKLLFATWDNHTDERMEKLIGYSPAAEIKSKYCPHFDGIGRINLKVGKITYEIIASHNFRGKSKFNPLHGLMAFCREQVQTGDIYVQGDKHQTAYAHQTIGDKDRVFIMTGTLEKHDDFTERYFSVFPKMEMPCVVLHNDERKISVHRTSEDGAIYMRGLR